MPLFFRSIIPQPLNNDTPLSLYVHIPWCVKKCPYCDFNSHEKTSSFDEAAYVKALLIDLETEYQFCKAKARQQTIRSIFFGGGTPSLFSAMAIQQIIEHARKQFGFDDIEITLEANPGTFEQEKFAAYKQVGVNRLSIGIQSFNASHLQQLGRIHDNRQALAAVETAMNAGFENINLDLMYGLPQQTLAQACEDISTACQFAVPHISHYQLTIENNTYFYKHPPALPDDDLIWKMQAQCQDILTANNYSQYEISAYARTAQGKLKSCEHNVNYWQFGDYIGIGAGAHGKLSTNASDSTGCMDKHQKIQRRWKYRQPQQYIEQANKGEAVSGQQALEEKDILFEYLLNTLRLKSGADKFKFEKNTGLPFDRLRKSVSDIDPSLLRVTEDKIVTTEKGFLFLNEILENLL